MRLREGKEEESIFENFLIEQLQTGESSEVVAAGVQVAALLAQLSICCEIQEVQSFSFFINNSLGQSEHISNTWSLGASLCFSD